MMAGQAIVDITKRDLFFFSLAMIPRLRGNWIFMGVLALLIFALVCFTRTPATPYAMGVAAVASLGGAFGGVLSALTINIVTMLLKVDQNSRVLGRHAYTLSAAGLAHQRGADETLLPWSSFQSLAQVPGYLLFRVSAGQFYLVPRRAFASADACHAFWQRALALARSANPPS